ETTPPSPADISMTAARSSAASRSAASRIAALCAAACRISSAASRSAAAPAQASRTRPSARATALYAWAATPAVLPAGGLATRSGTTSCRLLYDRDLARTALAQAYAPPLVLVFCGHGRLRV